MGSSSEMRVECHEHRPWVESILITIAERLECSVEAKSIFWGRRLLGLCNIQSRMSSCVSCFYVDVLSFVNNQPANRTGYDTTTVVY